MDTLVSCINHPKSKGRYKCGVCASLLCDECVRARDDGVLVCESCLRPEAILADDGPYELAGGGSSVGGPPPLPQYTSRFGMCRVHPEMGAVALCASCQAPVCGTCDFAFPGGVHLCPQCATDTDKKLTPARKRVFVWSLACGIGALLFTGLLFLMLFSGAFREGGAEGFGVLIMGCFVVALVGLVMGISNFSRKSHNPGILWIAPIISGIPVVIWALLILAGLMKR